MADYLEDRRVEGILLEGGYIHEEGEDFVIYTPDGTRQGLVAERWLNTLEDRGALAYVRAKKRWERPCAK